MAITFNDVRNERQWKASTGLSNEQFLSLVKLFGQAYELLFGESMEVRQNNPTGTSTFKTYGAYYWTFLKNGRESAIFVLT